MSPPTTVVDKPAAKLRDIHCFTKQVVHVPDILTIVEVEPGRPWPATPNHGVFSIVTAPDGDKRIVWNRFSLEEIVAARELFRKLLTEGMDAFRVDLAGRKGERIQEFDPSLEEIIFLPMQAICGG